MPRILAFHNSTGSRAWRLTAQLRYLQEKLHWNVKEFSGKGKVDAVAINQAIDWADVVIFQSVFDNRMADFIKEKGKKLIFEFDDLIDKVPAKHPIADMVNTPEWTKQIRHVLEIADVLITTNENLKNRFWPLNHNIHVFPNYMDIDFWERPHNPNTNKKQIRLGWAGGISHQEDLEWIAPVIGKILKKYENVKFIYCGDGGVKAADKLMTFNYGEDHFANLPINRREYVMGSPIETYPDKLNSLQLDIAIAPLVFNDFAVCKTPIKWMEYGINKVPCVGQRFMYKQVIENEVNGLLAEKEDEWYNCISRLIENEDFRVKLGEKAYKDVHEKHDIKTHVDKWVEIIQS